MSTTNDHDHDNDIVNDAEAVDVGIPDAKEGEIDFLKDDASEMTYGRRLALYLMKNYKWYNPYLEEDEDEENEENENKNENENESKKQEQEQEHKMPKPSLAKAWAYFEHVTLERYELPDPVAAAAAAAETAGEEERGIWEKFMDCFFFRDVDTKNIAEPGEHKVKTKLYDPLTTPLSQLGDFGLGYGVYFSTLRAYGILFLFAGLLNIPNMMYYAGEDYSQGQPGITGLTRGSAICTDRSWVPCPTCGEHPEDGRTFGAGFTGGRVRNVVKTFFYPNVTNGDGGGGGNFVNISNYLTEDLYDKDDYFDKYEEQVLEGIDETYDIRLTYSYKEFSNAAADQVIGLCLFDCVIDFIEFDELGYAYMDVSKFLGPNSGDMDRQALVFVEKTNCDGATLRQGFINYATIFFVILGAMIIHRRQDTIITVFDQDEQTAQDYSIRILDPPGDACDPDDWKDFFESTFDCKVVVCCVDKQNDDIIQLLIKRRETFRQIVFHLPHGTDLSIDNLEKEAEKKENKGLSKLLEELKEATASINAIVDKKEPREANSIYVTFETEAAQREVLSALSIGTFQALLNCKFAISDDNHLFQGKTVIKAIEPDEPSAVRWQELDRKMLRRAFSLILTTALTLLACLVGFLIILLFYVANAPYGANLMTTVFTTVFPMIATSLMNKEHHQTESSRQKWYFIKVAVFNLVVTTILISFIYPFTSTLDPPEGSIPGQITAVRGLFYSQLVISPVLQLMDIGGNLNRHIFAPRKTTQVEMDLCMKGSGVQLSERYANLIKYMFLMLWFCALFPSVFFIGAFALFVVYFADRFSLMRTWARSPQLGTDISDFARHYFTPAAIFCMVTISAYAWSGFPYDNLCVDDETILPAEFLGDWDESQTADPVKLLGFSLFSLSDVNITFSIDEDAQVYKRCNQDLRESVGRSFPPLPTFQPEGSEWMTPDQENVVGIFGLTTLIALVFVFYFFVGRILWSIVGFFMSNYTPRGQDMKKPYSQEKNIDSYVPQYKSNYFTYPLILCDTTGLDRKVFSWTDPDKDHSFFEVIRGAEDFVNDTDFLKNEMLSKVKYYSQLAPNEPEAAKEKGDESGVDNAVDVVDENQEEPLKEGENNAVTLGSGKFPSDELGPSDSAEQSC